MKWLVRIVLGILVFSSGALPQETTQLRVINVTFDTRDPKDLVLNRGRILWKDQDFQSEMYNLKLFTGQEVVKLDSNLVDLSAALDGDFVVWNVAPEPSSGGTGTQGELNVYNMRTWETTSLGEAYHAGEGQTVALHNGLVAFTRDNDAGGTEIVLHHLITGKDTTLSAGTFNLQPSVHHGQVAWVAAASELTESSSIYFYDGQSVRRLSNSESQNRPPILRDGQVAWLQSDEAGSRVRLFTGDSTMTLAEPGNPNTVIKGFDLGGGIAVVALMDTLSISSQIIIFNSETGNATTLLESTPVAYPHVDNDLVTWVVGTPFQDSRLKSYDVTTKAIELLPSAVEAVTDDRQFAWTFGEAVEFGSYVTSEQITDDGENGWEQTRFKNIDNGNIVWGNFENSTNMRLFYSDGTEVTQLTDSTDFKDFVMANDGYVIWRNEFNFLHLFDGVNPPQVVVENLQLENPYTAGGTVGFFGFDVNNPDQVRPAWLYGIESDTLIQLTEDDSDNWTVLVDGHTACWLDRQTERLMFYHGNSITALSDSTTEFVYSYRNGKIVWSERRDGVFQVFLYDVSTAEKTQLTEGPVHKVKPATDGAHVVWFENAEFPRQPENPVMIYYDLSTGEQTRVTHYYHTDFRPPWMDDGKFAWSQNQNLFVYDGQTISQITADDIAENLDVSLDDSQLLWRRKPGGIFNGRGDIFKGKLRPHVDFDAHNITGPAPLTVSFFSRAWLGAQSVQWDFGDGSGSTQNNPQHTYQQPGVYTVTLTATGPTGSVSERKIGLVRVEQPTSVSAKDEALPQRFQLYQNYPNPFNATTTIEYALPQAAHVTLKVFNLLGEEVATLVDARKEPGRYRATWDAQGLASGVYVYKLEANSRTLIRKLLLLK